MPPSHNLLVTGPRQVGKTTLLQRRPCSAVPRSTAPAPGRSPGCRPGTRRRLGCFLRPAIIPCPTGRCQAASGWPAFAHQLASPPL